MKLQMNKRHAAIAIVALCMAIPAITICAMCSKGDDKVKSIEASQPTDPVSESPEPTAEPTADLPATLEPEWQPNEKDIELIAKTLYGECRGVGSITEQAAVAWCILNRVDSSGYACGRSVEYVATFPNQFQGYKADNPVLESLAEIAKDVLIRHHREQNGESDVGRVLPKDYIYFIGDLQHNYFSSEYLSKDYWDWSLESPYRN